MTDAYGAQSEFTSFPIALLPGDYAYLTASDGKQRAAACALLRRYGDGRRRSADGDLRQRGPVADGADPPERKRWKRASIPPRRREALKPPIWFRITAPAACTFM